MAGNIGRSVCRHDVSRRGCCVRRRPGRRRRARRGIARPAAAAERRDGHLAGRHRPARPFSSASPCRAPAPMPLPGEDELKGFELAIEHFNAGDAADPQDRAQGHQGPARQAGDARRRRLGGQAECRGAGQLALHQREQGDDVRRLVSTAVAVALNKLAQREKVIYLPGITGSNDTTGKDCVRYSFRTASMPRPPRRRWRR